MPSRGALIVVEGLDRAGKSTQVQRLATNLQKEGFSAENMRFPDRNTAIGKSIDSYLKSSSNMTDQTVHLLFSANRWEAVEKIRETIQSGKTLIIDRYSYSGAVYSAAKQNTLLDLEWAWAPEIGLPQPDLVIFLTISTSEAKARGGYGDERYENEIMQERVRELFVKLLQRLPGNIQKIDASGSLEEVEGRVLDAAKGVIHALTAPEENALPNLGPLRAPRS